MGRPKKEFDWPKLNAILQYSATKADCADVMEVSEDTIERRIKKEYGLTFAAYRTKKMGKVRIMLVQKAIEQAKSGNATMMIFCLKNLCGWADKQEVIETKTETRIVEVRRADQPLE